MRPTRRQQRSERDERHGRDRGRQQRLLGERDQRVGIRARGRRRTRRRDRRTLPRRRPPSVSTVARPVAGTKALRPSTAAADSNGSACARSRQLVHEDRRQLRRWQLVGQQDHRSQNSSQTGARHQRSASQRGAGTANLAATWRHSRTSDSPAGIAVVTCRKRTCSRHSGASRIKVPVSHNAAMPTTAAATERRTIHVTRRICAAGAAAEMLAEFDATI